MLPTVMSYKDLGIHVDANLCFATHIANVVTRAKLRACQILRCFHSKDPGTLSKAFTVYVRPLLEYCSPVWSPCTVTAVNKLESVQRSFTKRLSGLSCLSYEERLNILGLERLEVRRIHADLIMCYRIVHGLVAIPFDTFFKFADHNNTRGHPLKLVYPDSRINVRAHSFSVRIVTLWNRLSSATVLSTSLAQFKNCIRRTDFRYALIGKV